MTCPRCQQDDPSHANFCLACGVPLGRTSEGGPPRAPYAELQRKLSEALEQQTAASEILRVIAGSGATDVTPVFDAILRSALALCDAPHGVVLRLEGDEVLHLAAFKGPPGYAEIMRGGYPHSLTRDWISGLSILERRAVEPA